MCTMSGVTVTLVVLMALFVLCDTHPHHHYGHYKQGNGYKGSTFDSNGRYIGHHGYGGYHRHGNGRHHRHGHGYNHDEYVRNRPAGYTHNYGRGGDNANSVGHGYKDGKGYGYGRSSYSK